MQQQTTTPRNSDPSLRPIPEIVIGAANEGIRKALCEITRERLKLNKAAKPLTLDSNEVTK